MSLRNMAALLRSELEGWRRQGAAGEGAAATGGEEEGGEGETGAKEGRGRGVSSLFSDEAFKEKRSGLAELNFWPDTNWSV